MRVLLQHSAVKLVIFKAVYRHLHFACAVYFPAYKYFRNAVAVQIAKIHTVNAAGYYFLLCNRFPLAVFTANNVYIHNSGFILSHTVKGKGFHNSVAVNIVLHNSRAVVPDRRVFKSVLPARRGGNGACYRGNISRKLGRA